MKKLLQILIKKIQIWIDKHHGIYKLLPELMAIDQDDLLKKITPGDIIYAVTPVPLSILKNIPNSHRLRPFIVAKKDDRYVYGYSGTSNNNAKYQKSFLLTTKNYKLHKDGMINLIEIHKIPRSYIASINDHLKTKDIIKINRKILNKTSNPVIKFTTSIKKGNIITDYCDLYYLYRYNQKTKLFKLYNKNTIGFMPLTFNNKIYYFNPRDNINFNPNHEYQIIGKTKMKFNHIINI